MFFRTLITLIFIGLAAQLSGCASRPGDQSGLLIDQKGIKQGGLDTAPALASVDGAPLMLYVDAKEKLFFRKGDGKPVQLDADLKQGGWSYLQLAAKKNQIYAAWWTHNIKKTLYFATSSDGGKTFSKPVKVTESDGVLPPYSFAVAADGTVGFMFTDERTSQRGVYFKASPDHGKSWQGKSIRLDQPPASGSDAKYLGTSEPILNYADGVWTVAWVQSSEKDGKVINQLTLRSSRNDGRDWGPAVTVADSSNYLGNLAAAHGGKNLHIIFSIAGEGIKVATAPLEPGQQWKISSAAKTSDSTTNSGLVAQVSKDDHLLYISWIAQQPSVKPWIEVAVMDGNSGTWVGVPTRLDQKAFNLTISTLPTLAINDAGVPLIAWIDYRNILPNIYVSASFDHGKTWTKGQDIETEGRYASFYPTLIPSGNHFIIGYQHFSDNTHKETDYIVRELNTKSPLGIAALPEPSKITQAEKQKKLYERVDQFWKYRVDGKFGETYEYFDPAFRSVYTKKTFDEMQGHIKYFSAKKEGCTITENVADCTVDIESRLLPFEYMGKTLQSEKKPSKIPQTWVWIDNNWYLLFRNPVGGPLLQY